MLQVKCIIYFTYGGYLQGLICIQSVKCEFQCSLKIILDMIMAMVLGSAVMIHKVTAWLIVAYVNELSEKLSPEQMPRFVDSDCSSGSDSLIRRSAEVSASVALSLLFRETAILGVTMSDIQQVILHEECCTTYGKEQWQVKRSLCSTFFKHCCWIFDTSCCGG